MKMGIIYYSRTGNTRQIAKILEEKFKEKNTDVELIEIEHVKRPGFFAAGKASSKQLELPIKNTNLDVKKYDDIILGSPTWAGKPSPFIRTFIKKAVNTKGKKVSIFGTGMSPIDKRQQFIEILKNDLSDAGLKTTDNFLAINFRRGKIMDGEQNIDNFVKSVLSG